MSVVRARDPETLDAVTLEVIRHGLVAAAEQMATSIERSAHSQVIREMLDYSTAVFDAGGGIVAQSTRIPMHLNSMTRALRTIIGRSPLEGWRKGDVYATNDPYSGGQHLPDIQTFSPVVVDEVPIAIVGTLGHHLDVGGRAAASYGADATEIYQEGFRIPPCRIVAAGKPNELFLPLFESNIRVPHKTIADLRAQIAALSIGAGDVIRLVQRYGAEVLTAATRRSSRRPNGECAWPSRRCPRDVRADDIVDGDGLGDEPVRVRVAVERRGDSLRVDFTGTAAQTRGPINSPIASTESAVYYAVTAILDPGIAPNHGSYLPIEVDGSLRKRAQPEAPCSGGRPQRLTHRIATVVMAALGEAVPARAVAPYYGNSNVYVLSAVDEDGRANVQFEIEVGGWGGRPRLDGPDCLSAGIHNLANNPIELVENEFPFRVISYALRQDSGGAGRFRGGSGVERDFELSPTASSRRSSTGSSSRRPGSTGAIRRGGGILSSETGDSEFPGKSSGERLKGGDRVTVLTQGGGGLGRRRSSGTRMPCTGRRGAGKVSPEAAIARGVLRPLGCGAPARAGDWHVGVDIGGTFTDVVAVDERQRPDPPPQGAVVALRPRSGFLRARSTA